MSNLGRRNLDQVKADNNYAMVRLTRNLRAIFVVMAILFVVFGQSWGIAVTSLVLAAIAHAGFRHLIKPDRA